MAMQTRSRRDVYILTSNSSRVTAVTGWRAWLILALMGIVSAVVMVGAAFLLFGLTVTIAAVMLFVLPLALAFALAGQLVRALRNR